MFKYDFGLKGLWLGVLIALFLQFLLLMLFILCIIKWNEEAVKAQKRAAVLPKKDALGEKQDGEIPLEPLKNTLNEVSIGIPRERDVLERNSGSFRESPSCQDKRHRDGNFQSVEQCAFDQQESQEKQDCDCVKVEGTGATPKCNCCHKEKQHKARLEEEIDDSSVGVLTLGRLSFHQLIWRRGLALFLCIVFLLVSIYVSIYIIPTVRPAVPETWNATSNYTADLTTDSFYFTTYLSN
jgi:hypothetical protein